MTAIGNWGEKMAAEYMSTNGFEICHRNWRSGRYELDIVARKSGIVHFVEVKCRKAGGLTTPEEAITENKSEALFKAAEAYVIEHNIHDELQFDLVSVKYNSNGQFTVEHIPNAIVPKW